ncbi:MAG: hypothetical protein ACI4K9_08705 [Candidatus Fimenecus sp.]
MKKLLSVLLAVSMLLALCVPAFAATEITTETAGDVIIKTSTKKDSNSNGQIDPDDEDAAGFKVTIPADTTIPWGQESTDVSYMTEAHLMRNNYLQVIVTGSGTMKTSDAVYEIPYTLDGTTEFTAENPWVYDTVNDTGVVQTLNVLVDSDDWNTAVVEEYQDTLTYTVSVIAP